MEAMKPKMLAFLLPAGEREPKEKGWRRVVFVGPDGVEIEFRG